MTTCSPQRKRGAGAAWRLACALLITVHAAAAHERPAAAIANALVVANEQRASIDVPASTSFATAGQPDHRNLESTSVRLVGGANEYEGTVEIFHDGSWGTICDDDWDLADANVVCKELFGTDANRRAGWVTLGESLSDSNFDPAVLASHFAGPVGSAAGPTLPRHQRIEALRPKTPPFSRSGTLHP